MNTKKSLELIDEAADRYSATKVFALFSGGHDSLTALHIARQHPKFAAAVHINTGVGVEATREFVRDTCSDLGCPLIEYCARDNVKADGTPDPQIYEQMVLEHGFPGPTKFGHGKMYSRLKERGLERLMREHRSKRENVIFVSGCRQDESTRRMGFVEPIQPGNTCGNGRARRRNQNRIWTAIIHDWTKHDTTTYIRRSNEIHHNPVAQLICKSGECFCGAFGVEGELEQLTRFPETRKLGYWLLDLQRRVLAAGFPWKWHERVPKWYLQSSAGQRFLFEMSQYPEPEGQSLCVDCQR